MRLSATHACPQCGGQVELHETSRMIQCGFCGVKNLVIPRGCFRFFLPVRQGVGERRGPVFYVPYFRFRGTVFSCDTNGVKHGVVDVTRLGLEASGLPPSLGMRPQAMPLSFTPFDASSSVVRPGVKASRILEAVVRVGPSPGGKVYHRSFIGESVSLVYLPLRAKEGKIRDAVTDEPLSAQPDLLDSIGAVYGRDGGWLTFRPAICPGCGWDLEGSGRSVVQFCRNCGSSWCSSARGFTRVQAAVYGRAGEGDRLLPFWRIGIMEDSGVVESFADFLRLIRHPIVVLRDMEHMPFFLWTPAFQVKPKTFLRMAATITLAQGKMASGNGEMEFSPGLQHPTLGSHEAFQCLKSLIAFIAAAREEVVPLLPRLRFRKRSVELVFLPFSRLGADLVNGETGAAVNENLLRLFHAG